MFPSEMVILMAIATNGDAGKKPLNGQMDVIGEYIGYLYDSLVHRGYLRSNRLRGYQLTPFGRKALLEFLDKNQTRAEDTIEKLHQLGIENTQNIEKLRKEAIKV